MEFFGNSERNKNGIDNSGFTFSDVNCFKQCSQFYNRYPYFTHDIKEYRNDVKECNHY